MSKSTKIIAGLGVVAALSVAALPVASYALPAAISGTVDISATVADSFSMTIDTDGEAPIAGTDVDFGEVTLGGTKTAGATSIVVTTNIPDGYTLTATSTGASGHARALYNSAANVEIPGYTEKATLAGGTAGWGIKVSAVGKDVAAAGEAATHTLTSSAFDGTQYLAPATDGSVIDDIASDTIAAMHQVTYTVNYGVATDANQASGTYTGQVTYTATPNAS